MRTLSETESRIPVKSSKNLTVRSIILSFKNLTMRNPDQGASSGRSHVDIDAEDLRQ